MKFKKSKDGLEEQIHAHESESAWMGAVFEKGEEEQSSPSHFSTEEIKVYEDCRALLNGYCIALQFFPRDAGCIKDCTSYRKPIDQYEES